MMNYIKQTYPNQQINTLISESQAEGLMGEGGMIVPIKI